MQQRLPGLTCGTRVDSNEVLDVSVSAAAGGGCLVVRRGAKLWNLTGREFRSLLVRLQKSLKTFYRVGMMIPSRTIVRPQKSMKANYLA